MKKSYKHMSEDFVKKITRELQLNIMTYTVSEYYLNNS